MSEHGESLSGIARWMRESLCLVIGMIISLTVVEGQTKKLRDIAMEGIVNVSIDRLGDFYLVRSDGSIHKYDTDGNFKAKFQNTGFPVTLLEPWNPLRVFV